MNGKANHGRLACRGAARRRRRRRERGSRTSRSECCCRTRAYSEVLGKDQDISLEMGFDDFGREVAGRKITLVKADTEAKPAVGLAQIKKLILRDRVDMVVGIVSSAVAGAVRDYVHGSKTPLIVTNAGNDHLTGKQCSPWDHPLGVLQFPDQSRHGAVDGRPGLQERVSHGIRLRGRTPANGRVRGGIHRRRGHHRRRGVSAARGDEGLRSLSRAGEGRQCGPGLRVLRGRARHQVHEGMGRLRHEGRGAARGLGLAQLRALGEEAGRRRCSVRSARSTTTRRSTPRRTTRSRSSSGRSTGATARSSESPHTTPHGSS